MADDRRTGVDGDQITDRTISETEMDISNPLEIADKKSLGWDAINQKFKWYYASDLATLLDIYVSSEDESSTTSTTYQDKISYTTISLPAGNYEFWYYIEHLKIGGAIQKVRLTIDGTEYCYNSGEASFTEYRSAKGFIRLTFATATTHTVKVQFASGTSARQINVRRARLRILSIGVE